MPRGRPSGRLYGPRTAQGTYYSRSKGKLPPKQEKHVKELIKQTESRHADKLYFDSTAITNINYTGTVYDLLNGIARGDGESGNFNGGSIHVKNIELRYQFNTFDSNNMLRVIVFQWRGAGAVSAASSILQLTASTEAPLSAYARDNSKFLTVLYDRLHTGTLVSSSQTQAVTKYIKVPAKVNFLSGSAGYEKGMIGIVVISDSSSVSHPQFNYYARVHYTD